MTKKSTKVAVIYRSKTGLTQKYAQWIAEDLHAPLYDLDTLSGEDFDNIGLVIYGGGLYAGVVNGLHKLKKGLSKEIPVRRLIVFATGASFVSPAFTQSVRNGNFSMPEQKEVPFYYFQAGINYERMGAGDRMLMRLFNGLHWVIGLVKKKGKQVRPRAISADLCDRQAIAPLLVQARRWKP